MAVQVDEKDRAIIKVLRKDAKASVQEISSLTSIPATTVHQRIKRMERMGVIRAYQAVIDEKKIGLGAMAIVFFDGPSQITAQLHMMDAVRRVVAMVGDHDFMVELACATVEDIHMTLRYLKRIDGVENVRSCMVLEL